MKHTYELDDEEVGLVLIAIKAYQDSLMSIAADLVKSDKHPDDREVGRQSEKLAHQFDGVLEKFSRK